MTDFMKKKRWLAIILTIVMLTANLSPVYEAFAQADTTVNPAVSEPAVSAVSEQAPAAPAADSSSGEAAAPAAVSEPASVNETAAVSEPVVADESAIVEEPAADSESTAANETSSGSENNITSNSDASAETQEASSTPAEEPIATDEPASNPTEVPVETEEPASDPTEAPIETDKPASDPTETPIETEEPASDPTETPVETDKPASDPTETPVGTDEPASDPTEAPVETEEPDATAEPEITPEPSVSPDPSVEPSPSPEVSVEPTVTPAPDPLSVSISMGPSYLMAGNGALHATAAFSGGVGDYSVTIRIYSPYSLENEKSAVVSQPGSISLDCVPVYGGTHTAIITVTDAAGQTAEATSTSAVSSGFPESQAVWEKSVSGIQLTGIWNEDLLAIARSQLGNREYESCFILDEGGKPHYYTRYGHWYGSPYQDWCAMFVAFCLHHAGISTNDYPVSAGCTTWKNILTECGAYEKNPLRYLAECETEEEAQQLWESAYEPVSGDLVFFNRNGNEDPCHVGIVEYVEDGQLYTIEGNADDAVLRLVYGLTDETIAGYANTTVLAERAGALLDEDAPVSALPAGTVGYTTKKNVNLRSLATITSDQLAQLSEPGTAVTVLNVVESSMLWYQVDYEGIVGYIRGDLLILEESAETTEPTIEPECTPEPPVEPICYCGLEVHAHSDECKDADGNVICELPEHEHIESCLVAPDATPEITPEPVYYCGLEVHTHGDECKDADGSISCEIIEHSHDDNCLIAPEITPEPIYYCGLEVHTHGDECKDADGSIICEIAEHTLDANCLIAPEITPEPVYYCGLEVHIHGDECKDADGSIICEITEHSHDDSCLIAPEITPEPIYYCGLEVHIHGDECKDSDGSISCEIAEHSHDDSCLIVPEITPEPVYYCGLEVHIHGDECKDDDGSISCEITEHSHDDHCLIAPEATPEPAYYCGLEVHTHGDECKDADGSIICEITEHSHDDNCLIAPEVTPEPVYYCGLEVHTHGDACKDADGSISCEITEHSHDDNCLIVPEITPEPVYYCGLEVHIHGDECKDADGNLICEHPEHEHSEACLLTPALQLALTWDPLSAFADETLVTLQAQVTGGVAPYTVQFTYSAPAVETETPETAIVAEESPLSFTLDTADSPATFTYQPAVSGTHTLAVTVTDALGTQTQSVFSLPVAQPLQHETEADFLASIASAQLTGSIREDIVAIAATQLGYTASATDFTVDESGMQHPYTRFGAWAQQPYAPWSASFVQFCLHYAGLTQTPAADAAALAAQMADTALYRAADAYVPLAGDVVFFDWDEDGMADHTGLVASAYEGENGYTIETIEGDVDGVVITRMFVVNGTPSIIGFGQTGENEKQAFIDLLVKKLDALPTYEEVEANLTALEDDMDAYESYFKALYDRVFSAHVHYQALDEKYQSYVLNQDKLHNLTWVLASPMNLLKAGDSVTVCYHNHFDWTVDPLPVYPIIVSGDTVKNVIGAGFTWWNTYVIEMNSNGFLYVDQYIPSGTAYSKDDVKASTSDGFVLLIHDSTVYDISVGDYVNVNFDYKSASSYNANGHGQLLFYKWEDHEGDLQITDSADTSELIELNLYDYGSNINSPYSSDNEYPGFQQDTGTQSIGSSIGRYSMNFGNNIVTDLAADPKDITGQGGEINTTNDGANKPITGVIQPLLNSEGYPVTKTGGHSLKYLFTDNSGYATKQNSKSINGLFKHNSTTGAYTFDSRENHAQFNPSSSTFTLYKQLISSNFIMYPFGNFLPLNNIKTQATHAARIDRDYLLAVAARAANKGTTDHNTLSTVLTQFVTLMDSEYGTTGWGPEEAMQKYFTLAGYSDRPSNSVLNGIYSIDYDNATNFFFGMEMRMNFMQPKNGMTGTNNEYPMVFEFAGDDDVWFFVDDMLFLELSGIHRHVGGDIDFKNGVIHYYAYKSYVGGTVQETPYDTKTFAEVMMAAGVPAADLGKYLKKNADGSWGTFHDYTSHTFDFFYMERGAGSSVCRINFNFPLLKKNSISVGKELTVDDISRSALLGDPDFKFQVLKANSDGTTTTDLFIGANTEYTVYNTANKPIGTGKTDANGVFTLKAGQRAEFEGIAENSGKYYVRELLDPTTFEQYGQITVGGSSTTTSNDVVVGQDKFTGVNSPVKDASDGTTLFNFNNSLKFNKLGKLEIAKVLTGSSESGEGLTFDFKVTVDGKPLPTGTAYTVNNETRTVQTEGIVSVPAGSSAIISGIIAGTPFTVEEVVTTPGLYRVSYALNGTATSQIPVAGTIGVESTVTVTCYNATNPVLPETGGHGTLPYTVGGLLTLAIATLLLYSHSKRRRGVRRPDEKANSDIPDAKPRKHYHHNTRKEEQTHEETCFSASGSGYDHELLLCDGADC